MNSTVETAGKTAKASVKSDILTILVTLLIAVGTSFKKVGGAFMSKDSVRKLIATLQALSNVGRYDTSLVVGGMAYSLEDYQVDTRLAAFVSPRAVFMPGVSPFRKDVRKHNEVKESDILTPAELIEYQYQLLGMFKSQPQLQKVTEFIAPVDLGQTDLLKGDRCHIEELAAIKSLPIELTIDDALFEDAYFNTPLEDVLRMLVTNVCVELQSKS